MIISRRHGIDARIPPGAGKLCPAAVAIKPVIDFLGQRVSFENVHLTCYLNDMKMESDVPLQRATRSLIGLLLTFSDCPIMMKLRLMAYFHVPLANKEHTGFRFIGMYLIAQYLRRSMNLPPDWDLDQLPDTFRKIHQANRIRAVAESDAAVNGLILLDAFAESVELQVEKFLEGMKPFFSTYLSE
ncbi:MAG: hypothetical protein AB1724_08355 [Thermodesulfobacteriota bacterium]